jgi:putative tricarboxylic transport membrane protein
MIATRTVDRVFAAGLMALGAYIVRNALAYGYMRDAVPGPGFFPFWIGLGLLALSGVNLLRSLRGHEVLESRFDLVGLYKTLALIGLVTVFILSAAWVGMLAGSGLLVAAAALVVRPRWTARFAVTILAIAAAFPLLAYFLFAVYLRVPLVRGVFGL